MRQESVAGRVVSHSRTFSSVDDITSLSLLNILFELNVVEINSWFPGTVLNVSDLPPLVRHSNFHVFGQAEKRTSSFGLTLVYTLCFC